MTQPNKDNYWSRDLLDGLQGDHVTNENPPYWVVPYSLIISSIKNGD